MRALVNALPTGGRNWRARLRRSLLIVAQRGTQKQPGAPPTVLSPAKCGAHAETQRLRV